MNRGIFSAASGMMSNERWMDVVTNNLANANTVGYKSDGVAFSETLEQELRANGGAGQPIGMLGNGVDFAGEYTEFSSGPAMPTGRSLDASLNSPTAMFAVQTPQGVRYTRDGGFSLNSQRELVNRDGYQVLDDSGNPITPTGTGEATLYDDGSLVQDGAAVAKLGIYDGKFTKQGANLYLGASVTPAADSTITPKTLEGSNVNAIDTMVQMIQLQRNFELCQKSATQQDEINQQLIQSLSA